MADASDSPETHSDPAPDAPRESPSDQGRDAQKGKRRGDDAPSLTARTRLTLDLRTALQSHQARVTRALEELLGPFVDDGERLELSPLLRAVDRLIADRQARILRVDESHREELIQDKNRQRSKREWLHELRRLMVDLRRAVQALFGRAAVKDVLGLRKPTAREPVVLLRQARRVLRRLQDPDHPWPEPKHEGASLDWDRWIEKLETPTRELRRALIEERTEAKVTDASLREKQLDLALYDQQVHAAARWIVATFELADRKGFGRSLLPFAKSRLRRSRTETVEEPPSEPSVGPADKESEVSPASPSVSVVGVSKEA